MKCLRYAFTLFLAVAVPMGAATGEFEKDKIAGLLAGRGVVFSDSDSAGYLSSSLPEGLKLLAESKNGSITHAWLRLPENFYSVVKSREIARFVASELLWIFLLSEKDVSAFIEERKLKLSFSSEPYGSSGFKKRANIIPLLQDSGAAITHKRFFSPELPALNSHEIVWASSQGKFSFSFPANPELILGKSKYTLERELDGILRGIEPDGISGSKNPVIAADYLPAPQEGIYISKGLEFYGYTEDSFYKKVGESYIPVQSERDFRETVANLLQGVIPVSEGIQLDIRQHRYSEKAELGKYPLGTFFRAMSEDHHILIGFEEGEDSLMTNVLLLNPELNYLHLIYFTFPLREALSGSSAAVNAELYAYIRLDNVRSFFQEYEDKKPRYKVKLQQD